MTRQVAYPAADQELWDQLRARPAVSSTAGTFAAPKLLAHGPLILVSWQWIQNNAVATTADVYDGEDANGEFIGSIGMVASGNLNAAIGSEGVLLKIGLFLNVLTGQFRGGAIVRL